ncbi:Ktr system potassium uptake protein B [Myxococcaceae bacterium]|nr:Ktr system potassium uptake protein B [Myxococcaceae bacterium]
MLRGNLPRPVARPAGAPRRRLSAQRLVGLSFLGLIGVGTLGFLFLPGLYTGEPLDWVDALFMATSAVCVTGLSVIDVPRALSFWGEAWLLFLIQAGGLGILTLAGVIVSLTGVRMGLEAEEAAGPVSSVLPPRAAARVLRTAVGFTVAIEAAGAIVLWLAWRGAEGDLRAAWLAVFHAVSAFCNAGFSLFSDSLVGVREDRSVISMIALLVIVGGLGFPVIQDLRHRFRGEHRHLTLHSRLVLATTAVLLVGSTLLYLVFEWDHALGGLGSVDRWLNALFMGVTARTAGFNTVDYDAVSNPSFFLTLTLMWIGGGPSSVAGGVKVTTAALLVLLLWSRLSGNEHVSLGGRTIPRETIQRATGLAAGAVLLLGAFLFLLLMVESNTERWADRRQLARLVFEVQSAFSTVGLSMNATFDLSKAGRLVLVPVMLLGRIGPLIVLSAMTARQRRRPRFRFAHEDVLVG